jgi:Protein of unknown function (DUF3618)
MESQSEQLEQEAEVTRWRLSQTLEELRSRITPGQAVDQLLDYTRNGPTGEFLRNLGREVRENPMPLVLIGIGIAWLMIASSRTSRAAIANAADSVARKATDIGNATSAAASRATEWGQQTAGRLSDRASNVTTIVTGRTAVASRAAEVADRARAVSGEVADKARTSAAAGTALERAERPLTGSPEPSAGSGRPTGITVTDIGKAAAGEEACAAEAAHEPR